jgi:hypothetical protein
MLRQHVDARLIRQHIAKSTKKHGPDIVGFDRFSCTDRKAYAADGGRASQEVH